MIAILLASLLGLQGASTQARGAISGQIQAQDGTAADSVRVSALPVQINNMAADSGPNYYNALPAAGTAITDSQGKYRLDVPPGNYYIMAGVGGGQPTYYPNASAANYNNATAVTVAAGGASPNINIRLLAALGRTVSGKVTLAGGVTRGQTATLSGSRVEDFLEVPISATGTFEFGRVPPGTYMLGLFPPPAGLLPMRVRVVDTDIKGLEVASPPTHTVTGKIVTQDGVTPIPRSLLSFVNVQSYVGTPIQPDGSFSVKLQAATHKVYLGGLPVGYRVASVKIGNTDAMNGFPVSTTDVSGVVITVAAPPTLPGLTGKVTGLATARLATTKVEVTGPIVGTLQAQVQPDGTFKFPRMVAGLYKLTLSQTPELAPMTVVVSQNPVDLTVTVPAR